MLKHAAVASKATPKQVPRNVNEVGSGLHVEVGKTHTSIGFKSACRLLAASKPTDVQTRETRPPRPQRDGEPHAYKVIFTYATESLVGNAMRNQWATLSPLFPHHPLRFCTLSSRFCRTSQSGGALTRHRHLFVSVPELNLRASITSPAEKYLPHHASHG